LKGKYIHSGRRGRDRMVLGFTTTYANSAYHHVLKLWIQTSSMARCTRYNIMWQCLSMTYDRSVGFSGCNIREWRLGCKTCIVYTGL